MNFYTLFTGTENVHLLKDVGMIPEKLSCCNSDVDSYLVTYKNGEYPYVGSKIINTQLVFVKKRLGKIFDGVGFIIKNSNKIDVLNIYHLNLSSFFYCIAAKLFLKKQSAVYLKLDAGYEEVLKLKKHNLTAWVKKRTIAMADIVSAETKVVVSRFEKELNIKIDFIPNGCFELLPEAVDCKNKKNRMITVGRLGAFEKNTEFLLDAFVSCADKHDWELRLIGPFTAQIEEKVADIFKMHPDLIDRIVLTGAVTDRDVLWNEYKEAKIFLLPSKWESFSIATIEALETGCFLMTSSNVPLMADIIEGGKFGSIVEELSVEKWSSEITDAILKESDFEYLCNKGYAFVKDNYNWDIIVKNLYSLIKNCGV